MQGFSVILIKNQIPRYSVHEIAANKATRLIFAKNITEFWDVETIKHSLTWGVPQAELADVINQSHPTSPGSQQTTQLSTSPKHWYTRRRKKEKATVILYYIL